MPTATPNRRDVLSAAAGWLLAGAGAHALAAAAAGRSGDGAAPLYKVSCTEYSLHRMIASEELDHLDFAPFVRRTFDLDAVEYWSGPFASKVADAAHVRETRRRADDAGVKGLVILVDGEGNLGDPDAAGRAQAVQNHVKWLEAAKALGCHSIRVNAHSAGSFEEQQKLAADGLRRLSEEGRKFGQNVIVENHGGLSSNGAWLSGVMKLVNMNNCGTFPDFGNFGDYDRYQGTRELMPWAKAVSAKSHEFDDSGNEARTDYRRMMKIVADAGYGGYVGIEYEGSKHPETEGVRLTRDLLLRVRDELAAKS